MKKIQSKPIIERLEMLANTTPSFPKEKKQEMIDDVLSYVEAILHDEKLSVTSRDYTYAVSEGIKEYFKEQRELSMGSKNVSVIPNLYIAEAKILESLEREGIVVNEAQEHANVPRETRMDQTSANTPYIEQNNTASNEHQEFPTEQENVPRFSKEIPVDVGNHLEGLHR